MSLLAVLEQLDSVPAPRGAELASQRALAAFCKHRWPSIEWRVERYGDQGANLVATYGPGRLLYSHVDTTFDEALLQQYVAGRRDTRPLRVAGDKVSGFCLGVARGPAAAALLGFVRAGRGSLLLAGSGTHRRGSPAAGLEAYLDRHGLPESAVVAKSGPPGLLWEEPGMTYLACVLRGRHGAALSPCSGDPDGGLIRHVATLVAELEQWTARFTERPGEGQVARSAGLGALVSGALDKPDLLPGALRVDVCLVTSHEDRDADLADQLARHLIERLAGTDLANCQVEVTAELVQQPSRTDSEAPVVVAARDAWRAEVPGPAPVITGWTGATDGGVLREHGVDTVRLGPQFDAGADDATYDTVSLQQLETYSRMYSRLLSA